MNDQLLVKFLCDADKRTNERIWELTSQVMTLEYILEKDLR